MFQDDFEDLCETLVELLGPAALSKQILSPTSTAPVSATASSNPTTTAAAACTTPVGQAPARQESTLAPSDPPTLPHPGASELGRLASELQTLGEETSRLRQGMDRLLQWTATASFGKENILLQRPAPRCDIDAEAREGRVDAVPVTVSGFKSTGKKSLWIQEQLLEAVEILLGEVLADRGVMSESSLAVEGGTSVNVCNADSGKRIRAAAAVAEAAVRAAMAARSDMVELARRSNRQRARGKMSLGCPKQLYPTAINKNFVEKSREHHVKSPLYYAGADVKIRSTPKCEGIAKYPEDVSCCTGCSMWEKHEWESESPRGGHDWVSVEAETGTMVGIMGSPVRFPSNLNRNGAHEGRSSTEDENSGKNGLILLRNHPPLGSLQTRSFTLSTSDIVFAHKL